MLPPQPAAPVDLTPVDEDPERDGPSLPVTALAKIEPGRRVNEEVQHPPYVSATALFHGVHRVLKGSRDKRSLMPVPGGGVG